jgi:hypothetical protein
MVEQQLFRSLPIIFYRKIKIIKSNQKKMRANGTRSREMRESG